MLCETLVDGGSTVLFAANDTLLLTREAKSVCVTSRGGAITHVGISLTFGLLVLAMICAAGDVSGPHLILQSVWVFFAARHFPLREVIPLGP
jgi:glycerol uptake facilitator-like aquaporin